MTDATVQVEAVDSALPSAALWGAFKVHGVEGNRLEVLGWALGTEAEVARVEIVAAGTVIATTTPSLPREELAEQMPEQKAAATCGFAVTMEASGKGKSRLELRAVLEDESTVPMGEIQVLAPSRRWDVFRRR